MKRNPRVAFTLIIGNPKLVDPVIDPRESWGEFFWRVSEFKSPPLVERSSLPPELQHQNTLYNKLTTALNASYIHTHEKPSNQPAQSSLHADSSEGIKNRLDRVDKDTREDKERVQLSHRDRDIKGEESIHINSAKGKVQGQATDMIGAGKDEPELNDHKDKHDIKPMKVNTSIARLQENLDMEKQVFEI